MELTLTEQSDRDRLSGGRVWRAKRGVHFVLVAAVLTMVGAFAAAPVRPDYVRIVLETFPSLEPRMPPTLPASGSFPDRKGPAASEARRINAAIAFAGDVGAAARPFLAIASSIDRDRAIDCLALAAMAEAGGGDEGQRAVIQVILNRVRHAAFAKTICGVVFEGSHRSTGCQFTFTCDGALARSYSADSWSRARARAGEALDGRVYTQVGVATHYHTDWVHPYWSASLLKLAKIDTHLFFRWPGNGGGPASLGISYGGGEPAIAQLAYLSAHADGARGLPLHDLDAGSQPSAASVNVVVANADGGAFVLLAGSPSAERARAMGRNLCAGRSWCKVFGWFDRQSIPSGYPVPQSSRAKLSFSYFRNSESNETILYDCSRFSDIANGQCLPPPTRSRQQLPTNSTIEVAGRTDRTTTMPDGSAALPGASLQ